MNPPTHRLSILRSLALKGPGAWANNLNPGLPPAGNRSLVERVQWLPALNRLYRKLRITLAAPNLLAYCLLAPYMQLEAGCQLLFEATAPSPLILMLRPRSGLSQQIISGEFKFDPNVPWDEYTDSYGNLCQRLLVPSGSFGVSARTIVETSDYIDTQPGATFVPVQDLPDYALQFLLPSRYCQADLLGDLANEIISDIPSAYDQVEAIRSWLHTHIEYCYDTSTASTSAVDTAQSRVGVCRDFVHLGIALCRSLTIPARMVVGYLYQLEPMDLHAWFEAYVGNRWYTFDATQPEPRGNRVAIAYGRDAADVALATQFGPLTLTEMNVWVEAVSPLPA